MRAISLIKEGWFSRILIAEIFQNFDWYLIPISYWYYLFGIVVLTLLSGFIQFMHNKERPEDDKKKEKL